MKKETSAVTDKFIAVRKAPTPAKYPTGHQGYHLPNDIQLEFKNKVLTIPRTDAENLLYELQRLLR